MTRPPKFRSDIRDVARLAGVSTGTVSRALRGVDRVSAATRDKVLRAAIELDYVPSPHAAMLASGRTGRTGVVGVTVGPLDQWFAAALLAGAAGVLHAGRTRALLLPVDPEAAAGTAVIDRRRLPVGVEGVLVLGTELAAQDVTALESLGAPVIGVGVDLPGRPCLPFDEVAAGRQAVGHLLALGHRRIAIVAPDPAHERHSCAARRHSGMLQALQEVGLAPDPVLHVSTDGRLAAGRSAGDRLLDLAEPPTAVLAAFDELAVGLLLGARARGVRVPEQLSVMGVDGSALARSHDLTTVVMPVCEQGRAGAQLLLDTLDHRDAAPPAKPGPAGRLAVRGSTGPPVGSAPGDRMPGRQGHPAGCEVAARTGPC